MDEQKAIQQLKNQDIVGLEGFLPALFQFHALMLARRLITGGIEGIGKVME